MAALPTEPIVCDVAAIDLTEADTAYILKFPNSSFSNETLFNISMDNRNGCVNFSD